MPGNSFGELFRVTTSGVSHGLGYMVIIDGCPPGLPLSADDLLPDLRRRRPGQSAIVTQRDEPDLPEIWSGVFEGVTDGTSIGILFRNTDRAARITPKSRINIDRDMPISLLTPSMASATIEAADDPAPARRICRVAAGAIAKKLLAKQGVRIVGYVKQIGDVVAEIKDPCGDRFGTGRIEPSALSRCRRGSTNDRPDRNCS